MVPIIVLLTVIVFIVVDLLLRLGLKRMEEARLRKERAAALDVGLKLEFAGEARSLKRVEVKDPRARILAVDDEPVVLDAFRKILVLGGYSVDTVETGQEALSLVRKNDYDFVFTDLKMPGLDGVDVTKAVKHLRPDVDVAVITGYATIESAVETMKYGAMDYVQKPFTEDELLAFAGKLLHRRQARIESATPPQVHMVTASSGELDSRRVINVPGGVFVSPQHTWVGVEITGEARVGLDDLALKTLGEIEEIRFPERGARVRRGDPLFSVRRGDRELGFPSPLSGRVLQVHHDLAYHLDLLLLRPFQMGWICAIEPSELSVDLEALRLGADALDWYEEEIARLRRGLGETARRAATPDEEAGPEAAWRAFEELFLPAPAREVVA